MSISASVNGRAVEVTEAAGAAAAWMEANADTMRQDRATLVREFRRFGRRGARLSEAAQRPMCIAVFGASQAGKSYLVSRLAAPRGGQPAVRFEGETLDFLKDINPPGWQEATGLVTRFTSRPEPTPPGAPVALRLHSQTDVVKILANTFLEDFDVEVVPSDEDTLARCLEVLAAIQLERRAQCGLDRFDLNSDTYLDELPRMDSLRMLHVIAMLEDRLGVEIDVAILERMHRVRDIEAAVRAARNPADQASSP